MPTWEHRIAAAGCRVTVPRRAVMEVLEHASSPLLPHEILERAQVIHHGLGLVTVYRTLGLLTDLSLVRRVHREDGCHGYLLASPGHHHAVICQQCGGAAEFPGEDDMRHLIAWVEVSTGYRVAGHLLQLYGVCPSCQDTHR